MREAVAAAGTRAAHALDANCCYTRKYAEGRTLPWRSDPLVQLVGMRARFMELGARILRPSDDTFSGAAFMTSIFSLVHVVLDMQPEEILDKLHLTAEIRSAILSGSGELGALLTIAQAVERGDVGAIDSRQHSLPALGALTLLICLSMSIAISRL